MEDDLELIQVRTVDGDLVEVPAGEGKPYAKSVRGLEIVQQERFGFNGDHIFKCLDNWSVVKRFSYIRHDKDRLQNGELKLPHWHLALEFNSPVPIQTVLNRFRSDTVYLSYNQFEKFKAGFEGAATYQTHRMSPEKFQYDSSLVVCNFDYDELADVFCSKHGEEDILNKLLMSIANGEVLEYNIYKVVDVSFYASFRRKIEDAFLYRSMISAKHNRNMAVIYVHGPAGSGKTLSAQRIAEQIYGYTKEQIYISSSGRDWIDGYMNEPCFILDDFRPKGTSVPKFLKALDNYCNSRIDSRYRSKNFSECKLLFITSVIPFESIWSNLDQSDFDNENVSLSEARKQLERRLSAHIEVDNENLYYEENIAPFTRYVLPNPAWEEVQARRSGAGVNSAQQLFRDKMKELSIEPRNDGAWVKTFTFRKEDPGNGFLDITPEQMKIFSA